MAKKKYGYDDYPDYSDDIGKIYALQLTLAILNDDKEYFIKLLSPSVFTEINIEDKLSQALVVVGIADISFSKRMDYIRYLIFNCNINESSFKGYAALCKFDLNYISNLYQNKKLNKNLSIELPINHVTEEKRTKV